MSILLPDEFAPTDDEDKVVVMDCHRLAIREEDDDEDPSFDVVILSSTKTKNQHYGGCVRYC